MEKPLIRDVNVDLLGSFCCIPSLSIDIVFVPLSGIVLLFIGDHEDEPVAFMVKVVGSPFVSGAGRFELVRYVL